MVHVIDELRTIGIIPVVALDDADSAVPLGQALLEGGLPCAEITFRTIAAAEVAGGVKALRAIGGPYVGVKFVPTGGITAESLTAYLSLPMVHVCGGSFMVAKKLIAGAQYDKIARLSRLAVDLVRAVRAPDPISN